MTPIESFLAELDEQNRAALERIGAAAACEPGGDVTVAKLLQLAMKNELEATECAASWIGTTPEIDVKLAFARQAGDEARHYRLIEKRLRELDVDARLLDPAGRSPMFAYLTSLGTTVERVAAGQFTREALAIVRNEEFVRFCEDRNDVATAILYREVIQPDERHHHELGRRLLSTLVVSEAARSAVLAAAQRTLALAEELQEIARMRFGISRAPGC
ncbi:MAG TPA: ferritin-like domain-containing protein [Polyangiaceae bacterium]|nr:ferritin-like domain-containing protein [Polyangiaceae bacterium]